MQYAQVIELIEGTVEKYKGDLYFGSGTINDLNKNDSRNYPLVWILRPVTIPNTINENLTVSQTFTFNLYFVQSYSSDNNEEEITNFFNDTLIILNGFVAKIVSEFDDEGTDMITVGTATQTYLTQDSVHIGWILPIQINSVVDSNCCSLFDE